MKALSIKQPWANMIASGKKTIETRHWFTSYRGQLLICSSKMPNVAPAGFALATCKLVNCRPMSRGDYTEACCDWYEGAYSWILRDIQKLEPFPVKGQLGIFDVEVPKDAPRRQP